MGLEIIILLLNCLIEKYKNILNKIFKKLIKIKYFKL